jgi:hypothetical protein
MDEYESIYRPGKACPNVRISGLFSITFNQTLLGGINRRIRIRSIFGNSNKEIVIGSWEVKDPYLSGV